MEQTLGAWVAPVLMIPGIALLIISTANRYSQIIVHLADHPDHFGLRRQLMGLRCALVALYAGVAVHAVAGLFGGLLYFDLGVSRLLMLILSLVGVGCVIVASVALAIDALRKPMTPKNQRPRDREAA
jgi:hypothetical protein